MAITTSNVTLTPQGGWTQLAAGATGFLRLSKMPPDVPVYLSFGVAAPTAGAGAGFRWECDDIFFSSAITVKVWGRISQNANGKVIVSVYND